MSIALLDGVPQIMLGTDTLIVASSDSVWNYLVVSVENITTASQSSVNVSVYLNDVLDSYSVESLTFPTSVQSATIGSGFTGSLKDMGIYVPALNDADLDPTPANFIPQCLCYPGTISTTDTSLCDGSTTNNRYNIEPTVV